MPTKKGKKPSFNDLATEVEERKKRFNEAKEKFKAAAKEADEAGADDTKSKRNKFIRLMHLSQRLGESYREALEKLHNHPEYTRQQKARQELESKTAQEEKFDDLFAKFAIEKIDPNKLSDVKSLEDQEKYLEKVLTPLLPKDINLKEITLEKTVELLENEVSKIENTKTDRESLAINYNYIALLFELYAHLIYKKGTDPIPLDRMREVVNTFLQHPLFRLDAEGRLLYNVIIDLTNKKDGFGVRLTSAGTNYSHIITKDSIKDVFDIYTMMSGCLLNIFIPEEYHHKIMPLAIVQSLSRNDVKEIKYVIALYCANILKNDNIEEGFRDLGNLINGIHYRFSKTLSEYNSKLPQEVVKFLLEFSKELINDNITLVNKNSSPKDDVMTDEELAGALLNMQEKSLKTLVDEHIKVDKAKKDSDGIKEELERIQNKIKSFNKRIDVIKEEKAAKAAEELLKEEAREKAKQEKDKAKAEANKRRAQKLANIRLARQKARKARELRENRESEGVGDEFSAAETKDNYQRELIETEVKPEEMTTNKQVNKTELPEIVFGDFARDARGYHSMAAASADADTRSESETSSGDNSEDLRQKIESQQRQIDALMKVSEELGQENQKLREDKEKFSLHNAFLRDQLSQANSQVRGLKEEIEGLKEEAEELKELLSEGMHDFSINDRVMRAITFAPFPAPPQSSPRPEGSSEAVSHDQNQRAT